MQRCDCCQEEVIALVPVVNRRPGELGRHDFLCSACVEVERFEHADELLWSPVNYQDLKEGRIQVVLAA